MTLSRNQNFCMILDIASPLGFTQDDPRLTLLQGCYDKVSDALVTAGWGVKSGGEVDSPTGAYGVLEVPDHLPEYIEMLEIVAEEIRLTQPADLMPSPGWYITQVDSNGVKYTFECNGKAEADIVFARLESYYLEWATAESEDDDEPENHGRGDIAAGR
jgi:hypothetical protein